MMSLVVNPRKPLTIHFCNVNLSRGGAVAKSAGSALGGLCLDDRYDIDRDGVELERKLVRQHQ
jgi:hypothetical protein